MNEKAQTEIIQSLIDENKKLNQRIAQIEQFLIAWTNAIKANAEKEKAEQKT